eukprot:TRINITY_DN4013_c0_g2_i1.p2 TRINITY_DN4013_c0_g2~~TRINITY_DN4013_c0_g2_i1.p2  ORF type:complete len:337 (+),score=12.61 TRINITY_DN4013_c0_g2_i1:138-1013(+)
MSIAYLLLGLLWLLQYSRFWRDVLQLQNCITAVVALGMVEMSAWYFDFVNFNATGSRPIGITVWAVSVGAVRKTVSRILILVVAMGFGVVRPTLGGLSGKVMALGGAYLLAAECLDVMQNVGAVDDLSSGEKVALVLPVAVLDAVFILWIFTALSKTLSQLQAKRTTHKLDLYRRFTNALALSVLASVGWIGYEIYFKVSDPFNGREHHAQARPLPPIHQCSCAVGARVRWVDRIRDLLQGVRPVQRALAVRLGHSVLLARAHLRAAHHHLHPVGALASLHAVRLLRGSPG